MSKRILATLAACALMASALVAPAVSDAKVRSHTRAACIFQPLDNVLGQVNILLSPIVNVKLRLCGPVH